MFYRLSVLASLVLLCCGCSRPELPLQPVTGRVTLGGGEWPSGGTLTFAPVEGEGALPRVAGWASFPADGHFIAECALGDGLPPGKYVVRVVCAEAANHDAKTVAMVSPAYERKPHEIVVSSANKGDVSLDIPKR